MSIPNETFLQGIHKYQLEALEAFDSDLYRYFFTEWGRRHRKTTLWLNNEIKEACRYPNCAYGHMMPLQTEARSVIWDSPDMLRRYLPDKKEMGYTLNEQKMLVKFANGSILKIGGADEPDSWRGIEFIGVTLDEAKHIKEEMWTTILLPVILGPMPDEKKALGIRRWVAFAYTPEGNNWVTRLFDYACMVDEDGEIPVCGVAKKLRPGYFASRLDGELAGIMSPADLAEAQLTMPKTMFDQEIRCARITSEEMTLITSKMLDDLRHYQTHKTGGIRKIISLDPGLGGDKCALKYMEDGEVRDKKDLYTPDDRIVVGECIIMSAKHKCDNFIVDTIGIGGPIASKLCDAGKDVQRFNSSEQPVDTKRFANKKAEMWWYCMERVVAGEVPYPEDAETRRQIVPASRYKVVSSGGKIRMVLKSDVKEQIGCSPDDADAWAMGIYGLQNIEPCAEDERPRRIKLRQQSSSYNYMAV